MKRTKKIIGAVGFAIAFLFSSLIPSEVVRAEELPYDTYNYNYRENVVITPAAYASIRKLDFDAVGAGGGGVMPDR